MADQDKNDKGQGDTNKLNGASVANGNHNDNHRASGDHTEELLLRNTTDNPKALEAQEDLANNEPGPPIPPDGGYGWVVMLASFMVNVIVDGVCFSFGIFYLEFLDYYGDSKAKTSVVGSVLNGMYLTMGKSKIG